MRLSFVTRRTLSAAVLAVLSTVALKGNTAPGSREVLESRLRHFMEVDASAEIVMNAKTLESRGLNTGAAAESIWSGDYWPLRYGGIASPYKNGHRTGLFGLMSWRENRKKFNKRWERQDPRNLSAEDLVNLAPSEKLDLLLSDYDLTLSKNVWQAIAEHDSRFGRIAMWEGVCHGWATAAIQAPRPVKMITVRSRDGKYEIPFHPHDLKALSSYLWANSLIQEGTRFEGKRCNNANRSFDPITGMSNDPSCNGIDPAMFHLTLTHLMGMKKESFIINKNNDTQVWNQPLHSYKMKFFNVTTGRDGNFDQSVVAIERVANDVRRSSRAPETRALLGVTLEVKYLKESKPTRTDSDSAAKDRIKKLTYTYDLELDTEGDIVGGQWRNFQTDEEAIANAEEEETPVFPGFPGFIWKIQRDWTVAYSVGSDTTPWRVGDAIPNDFLDRSKQASNFRYKFWKYDANGNVVVDANGNWVVDREELRPQPLSLIVHGLLREAMDASDHRTLGL